VGQANNQNRRIINRGSEQSPGEGSGHFFVTLALGMRRTDVGIKLNP